MAILSVIKFQLNARVSGFQKNIFSQKKRVRFPSWPDIFSRFVARYLNQFSQRSSYSAKRGPSFSSFDFSALHHFARSMSSAHPSSTLECHRPGKQTKHDTERENDMSLAVRKKEDAILMTCSASIHKCLSRMLNARTQVTFLINTQTSSSSAARAALSSNTQQEYNNPSRALLCYLPCSLMRINFFPHSSSFKGTMIISSHAALSASLNHFQGCWRRRLHFPPRFAGRKLLVWENDRTLIFVISSSEN